MISIQQFTRSVVAIVDDVVSHYVEEDTDDDTTSLPQEKKVSPIPNQIQRTLENQISILQMDPDGSNSTVIEGRNVVIHAVKIPRESLINNNLAFERFPSEAGNGSSTRVQAGSTTGRTVEVAISLPNDVFASNAGNVFSYQVLMITCSSCL